MRLGHFIVGVTVVVACARLALHTSSGDHTLIAISGESDFARVVIFQTSPEHVFTIGPDGEALQEDTVSSITTCPGFTLETVNGDKAGFAGRQFPIYRRCLKFGGTGYGGTGDVQCIDNGDVGTMTFGIKFAPTTTGPKSCVIYIDGSSPRSFLVQGIGRLPDHAYAIAPALPNVDFSQVRTNHTGSRTVQVNNAGELDLTINSAQLTGVTGTQFVVTSGQLGPHTIKAGTFEDFEIQCQPGPLDLGPLTASLTLDTDADAPAPKLIVLPLDCTGINSNVDVALDHTQLAARVMETDSIHFTLHNDGTAGANIQSVTLTGNTGQVTLLNAPSPNTPLPINQFAGFDIQYTPTAGFHGTLGRVTVNIENEVQRIYDLHGDATVATPRAEPGSYQFPPACVSTTTPTSISVYAESDGAFEVTGFTAPGPQGNPFTVNTLLPGVVEPEPFARTVDFQITATPQTPGDYIHTLTVQTDSLTQPTVDVELKVTALSPGVSASPDLLPFERTVVGGVGQPQRGFFTNCNTNGALVHVTEIRIDGPDAADFTITGVSPSTAPFDLATASPVSIDVQPFYQSEGLKVARIVIDYDNDQERTIDLTGEAFEPEVVPDRDSYYRCSTGTGAPAWPVVGVVWLVVRRRKRRYASGSDGRATQDRDRSDPRR